ncbi:hypothetical protein HYU06_06410 [Candidatus Woesearchaeota archaeon]|nr:hypothetical protein [Candidatus Woesearchaeota archaeon]
MQPKKILAKSLHYILRYVFRSEKHLKIAIIAAVLLSALALFYNYLIVIFFIALGAVSLIHTIWTKNYIGFELCTLATVICAIKFGPLVGAVVGATSIVLGLILSINLDAGLFLAAVMFGVIGVIASFFTFQQVLFAGMLCAIIYDAVMVGFYLFMGSSPVTSGIYFITHMLTTYYVFMFLAPVFVPIVNAKF